MVFSGRAGPFRALDGAFVPRLGLGTWRMGEDPSRRRDETDALRRGLDLGLRLIDTAEMYGQAEQVVGDAVAGRREAVYLVTKVLPENASRRGTIEAAERSLRNLRTEILDLYLLHWPGRFPLEETLEAFVELKAAGKIRDFGVSNFDVDDIKEAWNTQGGGQIVTNQILYNLSRRGPEWELMDLCRDHDVSIMAYSPLHQDELLDDSTLGTVARRHGTSPAAVALAWVLRLENVLTIPKAGKLGHVAEDVQALDLELTAEDLAELDLAFPPPDGPAALGTL